MQQLENTFHDHFEITSYMVDEKQRLSPVFIFYLMQDIAVRHCAITGASWEFMHDLQLFWALSRTEVEIVRRPNWHEQIEVTTWEKKPNYLIQPRDHQIDTLNGETLVRSTSNWVLLDAEGKPRTLEGFEHLLHPQLDLHAIERPAARLRESAVSDEQQPIFKPVLFSHLDMNHHVNNASYVLWAIDDFDKEFLRSHELTSLSLNFIQQMRGDDSYGIYRKEIAPGQFLSSIVSMNEKVEVCRVRTTWKEEE